MTKFVKEAYICCWILFVRISDSCSPTIKQPLFVVQNIVHHEEYQQYCEIVKSFMRYSWISWSALNHLRITWNHPFYLISRQTKQP